ncbi:hypothetical protein MB901379_03886 [Mycobacterium basiliense]|uniref:Uncharacterized protein n=1 Tax=Mycobacterium basiliense TaxID=2094119 RepID=A0A3S4FTB5_9MYCO|nr:hypothetical protein [Mycobacterium basiliense]VDM90290.1 hypothetical protein MB901379_03886 [Mycobacterium basiliense]
MMFPDRTAAAPLDALLLAQTLWRDDHEATQLLFRDCDPYAVTRQLAGWLRCAIQTALAYGAGPEFGDENEFDVLRRWIQDVQQEVTQ